MCGIAGVIYKHAVGPVGQDIRKLTQALDHRGEDSSGVAVFGSMNGSELQINLRIQPGLPEHEAEIFKVTRLLEDEKGQVLGVETRGNIMVLCVSYPGPVDQLCYKLNQNGIQTISMGEHLQIYKDMGKPEHLDEIYNFSSMQGTHAIGHTRLATESSVSPDRAHPFWAYGFKDVAIVHNGQLTNYWKLRRRFQKMGYEFRTDNDSELIAVYAAHYLSGGMSLHDVLCRSLGELDGTFTFLVATPKELGFAKDKLAAKPLVFTELEDRILLASEEVSLRAVLNNEKNPPIVEPAPFTVATWSIQGEKTFNRFDYREVELPC